MQHDIHELLARLPGTARQIHSFSYGPTGAGKVYIQASLHADELPGMLVAWHLRQRLAELEDAGLLRQQVVIVPIANPAGLDQIVMDTPLGRYELETGENFNRRFVDLADQVGCAVEPLLGDDEARNTALIRTHLSQALNQLQPTTALQSQRLTLQRLACDADMVLDLHCDFEAVQHLYTTPEAWPLVEPLARYLGAQASLLATDSGGQSFDECFSLFWWQLQQRFAERFPIAMGSFSVTVELRGQGDVNHPMASGDCQAILDYLASTGAIDRTPSPLPALLAAATPLAGVEPVTAPVGGLLVFSVMSGQYLEAGQLIAEIIDPLSNTVTPVRNRQPGLMYARSLRRMATAGMLVAHVAGTQACRSGYLLQP